MRSLGLVLLTIGGQWEEVDFGWEEQDLIVMMGVIVPVVTV